jgi:hypothetical protein
MRKRLDMHKIARALGAERRKVDVSGGYFGALGLAADIEARFRVPSDGGRPTDPGWTERRLVPLSRERSGGSRRSPQNWVSSRRSSQPFSWRRKPSS